MGRVCSEAGTQADSIICISAALTESFQNIPDMDILRDMVIPAILQTVVKGLDYFITYFHVHTFPICSAVSIYFILILHGLVEWLILVYF